MLREWRERALLTQESLAERTGLGVRTVRRLEAGSIARPHGRSLRLLADALGLSEAERAELVAAGTTDEAARVARQLPHDVAGFTGRTEQLRQLDGAGTVVVTGTAGVGKTALAVHWAHRAAAAFPDGQLFVDLRGFGPSGTPMSAAEAVRGFLDALGVPPRQRPTDPQAQAALYRSLLAGRRMLVVLDNARDVEQVRPLLPGEPGCVALVTSRDRLTGLVATSGARPVVLDLMTADEARELMAVRLGRERTGAEPEATDEIVRQCARLPLALAIAAARAATGGDVALAALADQLRDQRGRLDVLDTADPATDVRAVFSWSYAGLGAPAARLFRLLGLHPGPDIGGAAAASLAGSTPAVVAGPLGELVRGHLLVERSVGRYALHDLLRGYAAELAAGTDPEPERTGAVRRMLDHYLHTAHAADRLLDPHQDVVALDEPAPGVTPERVTDAPAWFTAEHSVLLAAVEAAAAGGFDTHVWRLASTLTIFLERRGHWHDQVTTGRTALRATVRLGDAPAQAGMHRRLAAAHTMLGGFDDAYTHLDAALGLCAASDDHAGQAHCHHGMAYVWERRGRPADALRHALRANALFRAAGHRDGEAHSRNAIGWYHALLGEYRPALQACQQALALHQELGNRYGQAGAWDSLGYVWHRLGEHDQASTYYRHALRLYRELGERFNEADVLTHVGDVRAAAGDAVTARAAWSSALEILDQLGHANAEQVRARLSAD
jgi:tetratricopeptide (TPR) repeat protein/transcriptional regulator with XRE-family HTH domain